MTTSQVRPARAEDADACVALRASMFRAMGTPGADEQAWQDAARAWFARAVGRPDVHVVVVEVAGEVVSGAMAVVREVTPAPGLPAGRLATVSNVSTLPEHRSRGYARLGFAEVMRWLREETDADGAELFATGAGERMYAEVGFTVHEHPAMRLRLP